MKRQHPYEIVPSTTDGTSEYLVRDTFTGRLLVEGCRSRAEAEAEIEAYFKEMDRFNAGPFSDAQSRR